MDPEKPSSTIRKVKFTPKSPPKRNLKLSATKTEASDEQDQDSAQAQALLRRWNENLARRVPKVERQSSVQVAFGPGRSSSPYFRTDGVNRGINTDDSSESASKDDLTHSPPVEDQSNTCMVSATDTSSAWKIKREYKEPWDYHHTYYPTTLPLRKPYSGDPEILDEEEFGEAARNVEYDESAINPAAELGLLERSEQQRMHFFQFPALPLIKQSTSRKGKEKVGASTTSGESTKGNALEDLSRGYMGKMVVYKSGAIKLKLGETLFDVSPGSDSIFAQDVVAMNTAQKHCCVLGELSKTAVVTPDIDSTEL